LIEGKFYDVTNLKHPGGSVIKFYAGKGIDATQAYYNFHIRSEKAKKFLAQLPSRLATESSSTAKGQKNSSDAIEPLPGQQALLDDFNKFTKQLYDEGYFEPSLSHAAYRIFEIFFMHILGYYLATKGSSFLINFVGLLILGIASGRCGWLMHECGHYSLTGSIALDKQLQIWIYGLGCGMSASWWRAQHNKHHSMPQKLHHDVDLNTLPLVAFTSKIVKKANKLLKNWISIQAICFPLITCLLVALGWQFYLHPRHIIRSKNYSEIPPLIARGALFYYLVALPYGLVPAMGYYLAYNFIAADYIFINFALSHTHLPTVPADDLQVDWVRYAAIHTMNVSPGPLNFVNWWMSYLNFQIEHHLFPSMPQFRHPTISKRVKALFEKHGLVYDQRSYVEGVKVTFQNLSKVGNEVFIG
jgi:acyl-CoA 6-desaturase (Delta-6 desaturase)